MTIANSKKTETNPEKTIAALKFLNFKPRIDDFKWRFLIQKIVALSQPIGLSSNYLFSIYINGPFSKDLSHDYYEYIEDFQSQKTAYVLTEKEKTALSRVKAICLDGVKGAEEFTEHSKNFNLLEATSTASEIIRAGGTNQDLFSQVKTLKPHLKDTEIVVGLNRAKELRFETPQPDEETKKEIKSGSLVT